MTDEAKPLLPVTSQVEVLERRKLQLEMKIAKLETFGRQLANCAYNLKQMEKLSKHERSCLDAAQEGWDRAMRMP